MNILTFDIEEWFHILDNESTKEPTQWNNYEIRIHANTERILNILDKTESKATFFCLGWIAEKYPEVIREIAGRGFHIASHTYMHQLAHKQNLDDFRQDVERSIKTLEDITGLKIKCFRAPGFSIQENNKWAFEILTSLGIEVDSSIFPISHAHGGFQSYKKFVPSILEYKGIKLKELPINYFSLLGKPVVFSGGGYFRLLPYHLIHHCTESSDYVMSYFHPRDFDPGQPVIKDLPLIRKLKSYIGLKGAALKLEKWLTDFEFTDVATAAKSINWKNVPVVHL